MTKEEIFKQETGWEMADIAGSSIAMEQYYSEGYNKALRDAIEIAQSHWVNGTVISRLNQLKKQP